MRFLKQNRSITRNVTEIYIQDISNEVLTQYFMLIFTCNLRNLVKRLSVQIRNGIKEKYFKTMESEIVYV